MDREQFLTEFLGALGAMSVTFESADHEVVRGTVHYDPANAGILDEDEDDLKQDFCWHMAEQNLPRESVFNLARLINQKSLLDIDKLIVTPDQLRVKYNEEYKGNLDQAEFDDILAELEQVVVNMVDDGEETDIFFIHE